MLRVSEDAQRRKLWVKLILIFGKICIRNSMLTLWFGLRIPIIHKDRKWKYHKSIFKSSCYVMQITLLQVNDFLLFFYTANVRSKKKESTMHTTYLCNCSFSDRIQWIYWLIWSIDMWPHQGQTWLITGNLCCRNAESALLIDYKNKRLKNETQCVHFVRLSSNIRRIYGFHQRNTVLFNKPTNLGTLDRHKIKW